MGDPVARPELVEGFCHAPIARPEYWYVPMPDRDRAYESNYGACFSQINEQFWFRIRRGAPTPRRGAPIPTSGVRPLPWREAERIGVGGYPQTPTKEGCALSGLSAGPTQIPGGSRADRGWGFRLAPTKEGCALSGLSRRTHSNPWREAERIGVGGYPQAPTKEGYALSGLSRRTGSPSRGSDCDMRRVRCSASHFSLSPNPPKEGVGLAS